MGKFHFMPSSSPSSFIFATFLGEGSSYLDFMGSHFHCAMGIHRKLPPPTGHRSQKAVDHSQSSACLAHAQWEAGCEATSNHSRLPTVNMLMPGKTKDWTGKCPFY